MSEARWRSCQRKVKMTEKVAAVKAWAKGWGYYPCGFCGGFHITHHGVGRLAFKP